MLLRTFVLAMFTILVLNVPTFAQTTGIPSFSAPVRGFASHEFGATLGLPEGRGTGFEGHYRSRIARSDFGLRVGVFDRDGGDTQVLLGGDLRVPVIGHSMDFPLDGSVVFGAGARLGSPGTTVFIPFGVSLGRRINLEGSRVSITPYTQPTAIVTTGDNQDTDLIFSLGLGVDAHFGRSVGARLGVGLVDLEGVALSVFWAR